MQRLVISNPFHQRLERAFKEWLHLTGYAKVSVYEMPLKARMFMYWLEQEEKALTALTSEDIRQYFIYLSARRNERRGGRLSANYLHKHLQAVKRLSDYLLKTEQVFFEADIVLAKQVRKSKAPLSKSEIAALYDACTESPLGLRDRAMLGIFYGLGLRRSEGEQLDTGDFLQEQGLVHVRKGKNYRERYVPVAASVSEDVESYLQYGRPHLLKEAHETAFFLSERGARLEGQSLYLRLKKLLKKAGVEKEAGLHSLRHSIATHLLESGMELSHIARFLGHESLESTQVYTHIINEDL